MADDSLNKASSMSISLEESKGSHRVSLLDFEFSSGFSRNEKDVAKLHRIVHDLRTKNIELRDDLKKSR